MQTSNSIKPSSILAGKEDVIQGAWHAAKAFVTEWIVEPMRKRRLYRQTLNELWMLDTRTLRDIGIHPSEIGRVAYEYAYGSNDYDSSSSSTGESAANDNEPPVARRHTGTPQPMNTQAA